MTKKFEKRKDVITELLFKDKVTIAINKLKPFYKDEILGNFDLNDDFIFNSRSTLQTDVDYFLTNKIDYNKDIDKIVDLLENSYYLSIFHEKTIESIKKLCDKIDEDLKLLAF